MADVLQVFELYLKKVCMLFKMLSDFQISCTAASSDISGVILSLQMAGECVDFRVNYDKLPSFVENSLGQAKFWQLLCQFVETLQVGKTYSFEEISVNVEGK
jgi:hypothetical protein